MSYALIAQAASAPGTNDGTNTFNDQFLGGPVRPNPAITAPIFPFVTLGSILPTYVLPDLQSHQNTDNLSVAPRQDVIDYTRQVFGPQAENALKVFTCESNLNPRATNWEDAKITGKPSLGVAQLNRPYDEKYYDYRFNIDQAWELYQRRGWQPWSCKGVIYQ